MRQTRGVAIGLSLWLERSLPALALPAQEEQTLPPVVSISPLRYLYNPFGMTGFELLKPYSS